MTNILRTGAAWLSGQLSSFAGAEMTFLRRGIVGFAFTATPANQEAEIIDENGFATLVKFRELIVTTSSLNGIVPRSGDRWLEADGNVYEVGNIGDRPCVDNLDEEGVMTVVRGKKIKQG